MKKFKKASDIKVGVIGYGGSFNMGKIHLEQMQAAGMTPVAVTELDKSRLKVAEEDFPGIETYTDVSEMLKKSDVNLIVIITPHDTHAKLALQCVKAGRHVVCEKPFTITTAEADAVIKEAKKQKVVASTYHNRHWDGIVMTALKKISSGAIGDVVRIHARAGRWGQPKDWWRSSMSISGGILYDWGVHILEYCLQILGKAEISEVNGFCSKGFWKTKWGKDANEDEATAIVRFNTGQFINLCISQLESNPREGMLEITGTKGSLVMGHLEWKLITHKKDSDVTEAGKCMPSDWPKFYQNIADHLSKGKELVITPEWARRPIHIIELAMKSAKQGKTLKAKYK